MKTLNSSFCIQILVAILLLCSCQKQILAPDKSSKDVLTKSGNNANVENQCRLVYLDWQNSSTWQFHYNSKGLADKWTIDYGYDVPITQEEMFYDNDNRLIQANEVYFEANYVYHFSYTGKHLTKLVRTSVDFPDQEMVFELTYNSKGQNIRQDDEANDTHVLMSYDVLGNCTKTDIYFGTDLWFSDNYTFNAPVRNPLLNIPGIEIGFPFYGGTNISNKRWFTSNRTVIYDNGNPFVYNDYDATRTVINTGNHNFPSSANYYDRVLEGPINIMFGYNNCNGTSKLISPGYSQTKGNKQAISPGIYERPMLVKGSLKSIKEQIKKMRHN